jgi:mono/diheme cytochrome c family protein
LTVFKPNLHFFHALFREKMGLIPVLGTALLLVGLAVATAQAAPPEQSPSSKPSAGRGEVLWAENCAPCHGFSGRGDGPTAQAPEMANNPPTDFTDRAAARQRTLTDMFIVTQDGRMDRLMPPWGDQLSDNQIWDVVAYAQTFAQSADDIAAGQAIYEANCASCHASDGTGADAGVPDLSNAADAATKSPQALFDIVSQGKGEMPAFDDQGSSDQVLSEQERWQVVDYLRTFGYEPITAEGIIAGQVSNGTTSQPVAGVQVRLQRWLEETELSPLTVQANGNGSFRFEGLDTRSHAFYRAEVTYNGIAFPGDFVGFEPGTMQLSLPVSVYETTTSDEAISVERFHFIAFGDQPGFFSVLELYQFSNRGDRAYVGTLNEAGQQETVQMALPAGTQDLFLQRGTLGVDFLETDEGLVATSLIVPGLETFEAAFVYVVPYDGATLNLDRALNYDTASVNGLVLDVGAKLESDVLHFGGERTAQGQTFLQYTAQDLKAGEMLPIRLADLDKIEFGSTPDTTGASSSTVIPSTGLSQTTLLWMVLGLGAVAVVFGLAYPSLRSRFGGELLAGENDLAHERQRLLLVLAHLDQAHEAGELNEGVYRRARASRKSELADVLRRMQEGGL